MVFHRSRLNPVPQIALALALFAWGAYLFNPAAGLSSDFFFGDNDPSVQEARQIARLFPSGEQLILVVRSPYVQTDAYRDRVTELANTLEAFPGVSGVLSLGNGPSDFMDAMDSPLWNRLIIGGESESGEILATHVIVLVDADYSSEVVRYVGQVREVFGGDGFSIDITGTPAILDQVSAQLTRDLVIFGSACFALFSLLVMLFFRSPRIALGTLLASLAAVMGSFAIAAVLAIPLGPLVGSLGIIIYVMTLSHGIFLAANLRRANSDGLRGATFRASILCALTTACGFASLWLVPATPLQQLGAGGVIGTLMAWICAYAIVPAFVEPGARTAEAHRAAPRTLPSPASAWILVAVFGLSGAGVSRLDTTPTLLDYFDARSTTHQSLSYLDQHGGSAPLRIIVEDAASDRFDQPDTLQRLTELQHSLDRADAVGSAISLPVLLAEANRNPIAALLSDEWLIGLLSTPLFDSVALQFLSEDRRQALLMLRMRESARQSRADALEVIQRQVVEHGFQTRTMAGLFTMQMALSDVLVSSIWQGCLWLVLLFSLAALILGRSLRTALALLVSLSIIPLWMYGTAGWLAMPVDLFVAPAGALAMGLAVDSLVHLTVAAGSHGNRFDRSSWRLALASQRRPILLCVSIVALGFSLFMLSGFPPTRRLGMVVLFGMAAAAVVATLILPAIAAPRRRGV